MTQIYISSTYTDLVEHRRQVYDVLRKMRYDVIAMEDYVADAKRLPDYVAYVNNQKEHHAQNTLIPVLEQTTDDFPELIAEAAGVYAIESAIWRRELEEMRITNSAKMAKEAGFIRRCSLARTFDVRAGHAQRYRTNF